VAGQPPSRERACGAVAAKGGRVTTGRETLFSDGKVMDAQRRNAGRMTDTQLLREVRLVAGFQERPPIRVAYLHTLIDEIAARGLPVPTL
jgi:hypothetical protein